MTGRSQTIVFRNPESRRTLRWTGVSFALVSLLPAWFIATDPGFETWESLVPLTIAVWFLYLGTRVADSAAWASPRGIKIVNPCRTREFEWDQAKEFVLAPYGFVKVMGYVVLKDDRRIHIWAIQEFGWPWKDDPRPAREIRALNQILAAVRQGGYPRLAGAQPDRAV